MNLRALLVGGVLAGSVIVIGEAVLNIGVLAGDWSALMQRFGMSAPTTVVAVQGLLKLLLLGGFAVWLGDALRPRFGARAGIAAGLVVWALVWAWVQWGMLISGYVTARIALLTVPWGLVELPLAAYLGLRLHDRLASGAAPGARTLRPR